MYNPPLGAPAFTPLPLQTAEVEDEQGKADLPKHTRRRGGRTQRILTERMAVGQEMVKKV